MASLAEVFVTVKPDTAKFEPDLKRKLARVDASKSGDKVGRSFSSGFGRSMARLGGVIAGALVVRGAFDFFRTGAEALGRIEKIGAQTTATLESTGGAANVTKKHIDSLAASLEKTTSVEAELITEGANLLLTFTGIRNEVGKGNDIFDQATTIVQDMSVALGQDTKSSAIQLGKALNDPIRGVTALRRVGVQFTEDQYKQIQALVESGDVMGAQKVILAELTKEFGGSAEALGETFPGKIQKLKNAFGEVQEEIVGALLPAVESFVAWLSSDGIPMFRAVARSFSEDWLPALKTVAKWIAENRKVVIPLTAAIIALNVALSLNPIMLVVAALAAIALAFVTAYQKSATFRKVVDETWRVIREAARLAWQVLGPIYERINTAEQRWKDRFAGVKEFIRDAWLRIRIAAKAAWDFLNTKVFTPLKRSIDAVKTAWTGLKAGFEAGIKAIPGIGQLFGGGKGGMFSAADMAGSGRAFPLPPGTYRWGRGAAAHGYDAQDLPVPTGTPVFAPVSGLARGINLGNRSYGKYIQIASGQFGRVILAHLSRLLVGTGFVRAGQLVGFSGSTGNSTGPHLHVEPTRVLSFDSGGLLPPGLSLAYNGTGRPEPIGHDMGMQVHIELPDFYSRVPTLMPALRQVARIEVDEALRMREMAARRGGRT